VAVGVEEAGTSVRPARSTAFVVAPCTLLDLGARPDREDLAVLDGDGFGRRMGVVHGDDVAAL